MGVFQNSPRNSISYLDSDLGGDDLLKTPKLMTSDNQSSRKRTRRNALKPNSEESMLLHEFAVQHHMTTIQLDEELEQNKRHRAESPTHTSKVSSPSKDLDCRACVSEDDNGSKLSPSRATSPSHPTPPIELLSSEKVESTLADELDQSTESITEGEPLAQLKEQEQ